MKRLETDNDNSIVKQYKFGNTEVFVHDTAYKDKTPEDIEKIKKRLNEVCWEIVLEARARGIDI